MLLTTNNMADGQKPAAKELSEAARGTTAQKDAARPFAWATRHGKESTT